MSLSLCCIFVWESEKKECVKKQETWELGTVPRGSQSNAWESKRRWGLIKKEQGREWKRELVRFLEINKDFFSTHTQSFSVSFFSWVDDERNDSPVVFKIEQWTPKSLLLHSPYIWWKGWNEENEGERYDCTLVSPFAKTKKALGQPWSIIVKEVKRGQNHGVDSVGGKSGQLHWLHPITPLNKSYQVLFFSYSNRTQMTEALVPLH